MAVAADARVNPALPATAVVEFMAEWLYLYPRTVSKCYKNGMEYYIFSFIKYRIAWKPCVLSFVLVLFKNHAAL